MKAESDMCGHRLGGARLPSSHQSQEETRKACPIGFGGNLLTL